MAKQQLGLNGDRAILFVGRIEPLKGLDRLLEAIACLPDKLKRRLLVVGGDENSREELERLVRLSRHLQIADSVDFMGLVRHEELPRYYSAADVCVVPSHYESFGLVALEALACGTPVVAARVGDIENIIRCDDTGYVVDDNAPSTLADKIALVLSQTETCTKIELRRAEAARFSWAKVAEEVAGECQVLLAGYASAFS
jgi:D-inositol-3-phosphate glycosyltransferase